MVRRVLGEKSIGHLGTLDPAAEGLLVLAVGTKALKVVELFQGLSKEYIADIRFGAVSTTYDREGVIELLDPKPGWVVPEMAALQRLIAEKFTGRIAQVPPAASAVHIGGERAYRKMRQGRAVDIPPRDVVIDECTVLSYTHPDISLRVRCGSGTYIRSLAHDLGDALRCGGYLAALRRTRVGEWSIEHACAPDQARWTSVIPLKEALQHFPRIDCTEGEAEDIGHGKNIEHTISVLTIAWHAELPVAILEPMPDGRAHGRKVL
jgi:tRNA pseudouridine55 synthase